MNHQFQRWEVVYGDLPHPDGWTTHYGVVLAAFDNGDLAIAVGTSQGIPKDAGLPWEVVIRPGKGTRFDETGLQKATRFDLRTHLERVPKTAVERLDLCGRVNEVMLAVPHEGRMERAIKRFVRAYNQRTLA